MEIGKSFEVLRFYIPQAHSFFDRPVIALSLSHFETSRRGPNPSAKALFNKKKDSLETRRYLKKLILCVLSFLFSK